MKKAILFLSVFLLSVSVFSQAGKQIFGLSAGAMFPMGDLADNNLTDSSSGVAAAGYHIQIAYDYQLTNNFGLGVQVEFNSAKYSYNKLSKYYENIMNDTQKQIISTQGWSLGGFFFRPYLSLPIGKKFSWEISLLGGFLGTYSPDYQYVFTSVLPPGPNKPSNYYRYRSKTFSLAYGAGTKLYIKLKKHGFFFEGRFLYSKANFKHVTGIDWQDHPYDIGIKMNLIFITASLGYTYYLN
ncbi:MAG: hypothetical protein IEMM0006_0919 [bacterium]|nr:MAG: hypothetical protein IEMM0006_0919 [bacterium]